MPTADSTMKPELTAGINSTSQALALDAAVLPRILRYLSVLSITLVFVLLLSADYIPRAAAQTASRPFVMPVALEPGPSTWLFGQAYGNTTGAFNFGDAWYSAGQGLHFGIDLPMPCGTPLVAVADGEVAFVDNMGFGAGPHNLLLRHPALGVTTLYGHLLRPAQLVQGQPVRQGQVIAESGDPDVTCDSRPHLHFEVRSLDFRTAYNPFDYIDANWHSLASVGAFGYPLFQQDLDNARRWMSLDDQPAVSFGGRRLNAYSAVWPLPNNLRPPANPRLMRPFTPLAENTAWTLRPIGFDQCCWQRWWHPTSPDILYVIDGVNGQRAGVFEWSAVSGTMVNLLSAAPPAVQSPDGTFQIFNDGFQVRIRRASDGTETVVQTQGATPGISADNTRLVWTVRSGASIPGQSAPLSTVWVSDIHGTNSRQIISEPGASASWLDAHRLLVSVPGENRMTSLSVVNTLDGTSFALGAWRNMRGLSVAPGGGRLMFFLNWQADPADDGVYAIETVPGASAQRLPWFGGWRWRDADSVYYLPLNPSSPYHTLAYYHIPTGDNRVLISPETMPFTVMNGDWSVSVDGRRIVFHNAADRNMWLLEMNG